jgi:hypothetical protein
MRGGVDLVGLETALDADAGGQSCARMLEWRSFDGCSPGLRNAHEGRLPSQKCPAKVPSPLLEPEIRIVWQCGVIVSWRPRVAQERAGTVGWLTFGWFCYFIGLCPISQIAWHYGRDSYRYQTQHMVMIVVVFVGARRNSCGSGYMMSSTMLGRILGHTPIF